MRAWIVLAAALFIGGCGARTVAYTPSPIDPAIAKASIEQVVRGLPGKRAPDQVFVTDSYFGYARGPAYATPTTEAPAAGGKSVHVQVNYRDIDHVDLIDKHNGRTLVVARDAKGRNLYKAVTQDPALARRFVDAVVLFKR